MDTGRMVAGVPPTKKM